MTEPADLILDVLLQEHEELQPVSSILPDPDHSAIRTNGCNLTLCLDPDPYEWHLEDEMTIWPASLHLEASQFLVIDSLSLPEPLSPNQEHDCLGWSYDANTLPPTEQGDAYNFEEDVGCSWSEIMKVFDIGLFIENSPQDSPLPIVSAHEPFRSSFTTSIESEDLNRDATENTAHDLSASANSTPNTSPLFSEAEDQDTPQSISWESRPSNIGSSPIFPREATTDIEVIDLTGDDLYASPQPFSPMSTGQSSSALDVTQRLNFVDLTQDDDDDGDVNDDDNEEEKKMNEEDADKEEQMETWYDDDCGHIDYEYRSSHENKTRSMTPAVGSSHWRKPSNFTVTEILHNEKSYPWNNRCKWYKNGSSSAKPNHKDTTIVIRDSGSDIPIDLKYKGFGIWEGSNYRIGAVISDKVAKDMVFGRRSLPLKRKRGCMYSDDLSPRKRARNCKLGNC
jgi:hypothetical protein